MKKNMKKVIYYVFGRWPDLKDLYEPNKREYLNTH